MTRHILILGGTGDARQLAALLAARTDLRVTLSLAGRTRAPLPQAGRLRVGGFGGAEGLARHLREEAVDLLVDATHPFAARISANAALAARQTGVPLLTLQRPPWEKRNGDDWVDVPDTAAALAALPRAPRHVFLAIGRQEVGVFRAAPQHRYLVRSVEPVDEAQALPDAHYLLDRGPFDEIGERALLTAHGIDCLVAKNSGGDATYAKIAAARALSLPVIMIARPAPCGDAFGTIESLLEALDHQLVAMAARGA